MKRNVSGSAHNDESYNCWKKNSPLLYDSLYNHNMVWPSLCVAWGDNIPLVPAEGDRRRSSHASSSSSSSAASSSSSTTTATTTTNNPDKDEQTHSTLQALYFSSRTDATFNFETKRWKGAPNFLCAATVDLPHVRHTNYRGVGKFQEAYKSSHINIMKRIVHPGEVNKIRLCPHSSDLLATHSDSPLTYIWNVKTQPSRGSQADLIASVPDLVLEGHTAMSEYALAWNKQVPRLVSGGSDHMVVLWDLGDAATTLFNTKSNSKSPVKWKNQKTLQANRIFEGHTDTVEDVTFHPTGHGNIFCSVGDDRGLIIWDARVDNPIAIRVNNAHQEDINCVDWNNHDPTSIISGSSDGTIHQYDYRMFSKSNNDNQKGRVATYEDPGLDNITNIQWSPHDARFFASAGDDGTVSIWDTHASHASHPGSPGASNTTNNSLMFRHCGHRASIVDFDWNSRSPWTMVSMSDDSQNPRLGGGTMQVWRLTDLLYKHNIDTEKKYIELLDKQKDTQNEQGSGGSGGNKRSKH